MLWGHSVRASSSTCAMGVGVDTTSGRVGPESAFVVPSDQIPFLEVLPRSSVSDRPDSVGWS